jgi:hypothetical protein
MPDIPNDYLIRRATGKPYSKSRFSSNWQRLMAKHVKAGGEHFTFHDLRSVSADGGGHGRGSTSAVRPRECRNYEAVLLEERNESEATILSTRATRRFDYEKSNRLVCRDRSSGFCWLVPTLVYVLQRTLLGFSNRRSHIFSGSGGTRLGNLVRLVGLKNEQQVRNYIPQLPFYSAVGKIRRL